MPMSKQKQREKLYAEIADRLSAYRASHNRKNPARIFMSKPLYELLAGIKWDDLPKDATPKMFTATISAYDSDKMEYSFSEALYEVETKQKEGSALF